MSTITNEETKDEDDRQPKYKIQPKEMIVTRTKSAQLNQKRQLRIKDRSMKKVTQLLMPNRTTKQKVTQIMAKHITKQAEKNINKKSPTKSPQKQKSPSKKQMSLLETNQNPIEKYEAKKIEDKDYGPCKTKEKGLPKHVILKANHELKFIGGMNKRKLFVPQRDEAYITSENSITQDSLSKNIKPILQKTNLIECKDNDLYNGLSVREIIQLKDQTEELSEEDFMAILTCPSPVWWEDQNTSDSDEAMTIDLPEEPAEVKKNEEDEKQKEERGKEGSELVSIPEITETKFGDIFLKKRSLLESLISNMKDKTIVDSKQKESKFETEKESANKPFCLNFKPCNTGIPSKYKCTKKTATNEGKVIKKSKNVSKKVVSLLKKNDSEELSCIKEIDVILNDLENISIPVAAIAPAGNVIEQPPVDIAMPVDHAMSVDIESRSDRENCQMELRQNKIFTMRNLKFSQSGRNNEADLAESILNLDKSLNTSVTIYSGDNIENKNTCDVENTLADIWTYNTSGEKKLIDIASFTEAMDGPDDEQKDGNGKQDSTINNDIPVDMPPLTKITKVNTTGVYASDVRASFTPVFTNTSESDEVIESSSNVSTQDICDTISDTNIKYLIDDQTSDESENKFFTNDKTKHVKRSIENQVFRNNQGVDVTPAEQNLNEYLSNGNPKYVEKFLLFIDPISGEKKSVTVLVMLDEPSHFNVDNEVIIGNDFDDNIVKQTVKTTSHNSEGKKSDTTDNSEMMSYHAISLENQENAKVIQNKDKSRQTKKVKTILKDKQNLKFNMDEQKCNSLSESEKNKLIADKYESILRKKFANKRKHDDKNLTQIPIENNKSKVTSPNVVDNVDEICQTCNTVTKKPMLVSEKTRLKYCFKCSSFFDTDDCSYCIQKDDNQNIKKGNFCNKCKFEACCGNGLKKHELDHGQIDFNCELCYYKAESNNQLDEHMWVHVSDGRETQNNKEWDHCYTNYVNKNVIVEQIS